jgi:hypothetical protein
MAKRTPTFREAAHAAARRLAMRHLAAMVQKTAVWICGGLLIAMIVARVSGDYHAQWPWVGLVLAVWLAAAAAWAWLTRPRPLIALAVWDQQTRRGEAFVSAYCFEAEAAPDAAQQVHLARARATLTTAWPALRRELPLPTCRRAAVFPPLVLALAASGVLAAALPPDLTPLDAVTLARAREMGETLTHKQKDIERLAGMTKKERKEAKQLQQAMSDTADRLARQESQTPQDVLTKLDALARQAEALAKAMGGDAQSLSSAMIEELERHADTTDFGSAIRASKSDQIAEEARSIAERLKSDALTLDERQRFEDALDRAMKAADEADRETILGNKLDAADRNLKAGEPREAAQRFAELSEQFDHVHEREQAAERLEQLAQELRSGGQRIMQLGDEGMTHLAQAPSRGMRPLHPSDGGDGSDPMMMPQARMPLGDMPTPGDGEEPGYGAGPSYGEPPMPGSSMPGDGPPVPGDPDGMMAGGAQPSGAPPIPGMAPGDGGMPGAGRIPGAGQGMAPGIAPVPGSAAGMAGGPPTPGATTGGLRAGHGTAPLGADPTKPHDPTGTATVAAAPVNPGASFMQVIDGANHREETGRTRREIAIAFIAAEEEALHAEPLPAARREQVLRYFTMLREQLEHDDRPRP